MGVSERMRGGGGGYECGVGSVGGALEKKGACPEKRPMPLCRGARLLPLLLPLHPQGRGSVAPLSTPGAPESRNGCSPARGQGDADNQKNSPCPDARLRLSHTLLPTLHSRSRRAACARATLGSTRHSSREGSVSRGWSSSSKEREEGEEEEADAAPRMRGAGRAERRRAAAKPGPGPGRAGQARHHRRLLVLAAAWEAVRVCGVASISF